MARKLCLLSGGRSEGMPVCNRQKTQKGYRIRYRREDTALRQMEMANLRYRVGLVGCPWERGISSLLPPPD